MKEHEHRRLLKCRSHEQRISGRAGTWGSDHSLISPPRNVLHVRAVDEFVTPNGASTTSDARAPLASNGPVLRVTVVLADWVSVRDTAIDSTKGTANRAWSATAARWGELAGRVVIPSRSGLVLHLSGELSQDVGWQLSVVVGLGNVVTKLG